MKTPPSVTASKRQFVRGKLPISPKLSVEKPKDLIDLLQTAIEVEHSTIPAYLCALYSIKDGTNQEAAQIIKSVVLEEMLHMILAANVLNAIGGHPASIIGGSYPTIPECRSFPFRCTWKHFPSRPSTRLSTLKAQCRRPVATGIRFRITMRRLSRD